MSRRKSLGTAFCATMMFAVVARAVPLKLCVVTGKSMEPMIAEGEICWVDSLAHKTRNLAVGDVIVFRKSSELVVKRVVGLPGDVISEHLGQRPDVTVSRGHQSHLKSGKREIIRTATGDVFVKSRLQDTEYYVVGDNSVCSYDSRDFGPISAKDIVGIVRPMQFSSMTQAMNEWLGLYG